MHEPDDDSSDDAFDESLRDDSFLLRIARTPSIGVHPDMLVGTVVAGRFRVEALAGKGGMGVVYRSIDETTGETIALKLLVGDPDGEVNQRFLREAAVLSSLTHSHIVRYLAHGQTSRKEPYLAMEWLDGEDLSARLTRGPLAVVESVALVSRVASALGTAHDRGMVHRDIKPHNLFLVDCDPTHVKVLDFGLARSAGGEQRMTRTGTSIGTPAYMSPEQARGVTAIDGRADIFALGATFFECLSGRPPFMAKDVSTLLGKVLFEEAPRIRALREDVPEHVDHLVSRMLAKEPSARPRHDEVMSALAF